MRKGGYPISVKRDDAGLHVIAAGVKIGFDTGEAGLVRCQKLAAELRRRPVMAAMIRGWFVTCAAEGRTPEDVRQKVRQAIVLERGSKS